MYQEQVRILADAGIDLIAAGTSDQHRGNPRRSRRCDSVCDLPIMCTMTVEADGSIFSGGNAIEAAASLEAAGADAVRYATAPSDQTSLYPSYEASKKMYPSP